MHERSTALRDNSCTVLTSLGAVGVLILIIPSLRVDQTAYCRLKLAKFDWTLSRDSPSRRKWIATFTGGGPAWVAGCDRTVPPKEWKRDVLLDVYEVGRRRISRSPAVLHVLEDGRRCCGVS